MDKEEVKGERVEEKGRRRKEKRWRKRRRKRRGKGESGGKVSLGEISGEEEEGGIRLSGGERRGGRGGRGGLSVRCTGRVSDVKRGRGGGGRAGGRRGGVEKGGSRDRRGMRWRTRIKEPQDEFTPYKALS